jgi:hypothetical protein
MFRINDVHMQTEMFTIVDGLPTRLGKRLREGWAETFYREYFSRLDERPFAVLYSDVDSRPNIPINVLVGLEALKSAFNWSDEEMYDAFCFDLQVRYALGYRGFDEGFFDIRTVYNFRKRLSEHRQRTGEDLIERSFEQVTDNQIASFRLKTGKARMDSSQIASNICNMSRLHLLVEVIQRVHRMLSEADRALYAEAFAVYMRGNSDQYVYRIKAEDSATHMQNIGELMHRLLRNLAVTYGKHVTYQMLARVFTEHFVLEQEHLRLKANKELSARSLQSPDDVEATFRNKNRRGYKGHVANVTETCDPDNPLQLIAKVQTKPNSTNDDDMLIEALPSLKERLDINEMYTDGSYNSEESYQAMRDESVNHVQTAIRGRSAHRHLGLNMFTIAASDTGRPVQITCPYGQTVTVQSGRGKETYLAHFDIERCSSCPFQDKCPARKRKDRPQRTLHFNQHNAEIARRRRRIAEDRQEGHNLRVAIESTIASLKCPFNYGQLPVRGLFRISMMLIGCAAMVNVRRIHRYLARERAHKIAIVHVQALRGARQASFSSCGRYLSRLLSPLPINQRQCCVQS